jgi:hypothetical protein
MRAELGVLHAEIRRRRAAEVLFIRDIRDDKVKLSMPPTQDEMRMVRKTGREGWGSEKH